MDREAFVEEISDMITSSGDKSKYDNLEYFLEEDDFDQLRKQYVDLMHERGQSARLLLTRDFFTVSILNCKVIITKMEVLYP